MSSPFNLEQACKWLAEYEKRQVPYWLNLISKFDGFSPPIEENKTRLLNLFTEAQASLSELGLAIQIPIQVLAARWYDAPLEVFSWWCGTAEILCREKAFPAQSFFDLLIRLLDRHAELNGNSQPKKLFWRDAELQRMIRTIKPAKTKRWELECSLERFKVHITTLSTPPTQKLYPLGLKVLTLTDSEEDRELWSVLSAFIHEGDDKWDGDYIFPLSAATRFEASALDVLTRSGDAQKKIALFALLHDLRCQWDHDKPLLMKAYDNKKILFAFVLMLGGMEFAKKADASICPHDPNHQSLLGAMKRLNIARKNEKARTSAKRRENLFIKPAHWLTC